MRDLAKRIAVVHGLVALGLGALAPAAVSQQPQVMVDVELVLAVDTSKSMDQNNLALQRRGYVEAFRSKDVAKAITSGPERRIAVTFLEWGAADQQTQLIPWTIIDSEAAARAFADKLEKENVEGFNRTSISSALYTAADLVDYNDIDSHRKVIDVSGDGPNNSGLEVDWARNNVVRRGFTINGLPIMLRKEKTFDDDIEGLDHYYRQCVVGGPGAFIAPIFDLRQLSTTVRRKLVLEIAGGAMAPEGTAPASFPDAQPDFGGSGPGIVKAQLRLRTDQAPIDCQIGEKRLRNGYRTVSATDAPQ